MPLLYFTMLYFVFGGKGVYNSDSNPNPNHKSQITNPLGISILACTFLYTVMPLRSTRLVSWRITSKDGGGGT